ncbi:putative mitochondrial GPI anchor biosynthesis protein [Leptomonas pyrrhocoris]|uniref:Mannosyltransferase n=1 Tax=Leptomonas pyrrhocoris TaxID=157538 RepID=A0A0N0DV90_LEPPY|nr:putative mitochondrial GPI anchor biosynthesis protein [Leptomonas pyrrhocoris]KPA80014.1 putative mitochondrial GPI anchor biosynthesis protein [Leptomonas pyrrhocoris]|eukprot:XP_015658453.1 putative mitochondrial GPI anchor biosynthesis protein [Leptomonas pyrrhocoris]
MDVLCWFSHFPRPLWSWKLLTALFLYRLLLCLTVRTAESPDEWWQSEEVAYFMVFGRGHLTWEWEEGIRSYVFPLLFAAPLFLLKWTGIDSAWTVWASSRCVQSLLFFAHDCAMLALAQRLDYLVHKAKKNPSAVAKTTHTVASRSPTIASVTLAILVVEWFLNYDGVRCYSNVAESLFFLLALYHQTYKGFLFWAGVACAMRVTAAFALLPIFAFHAYQTCRQKGLTRGVFYLLLITFGMGLGIGLAVCAVDFVFYRRVVITPLRFLRFNILMDVSRYYGVQPAYWYVALLPVLTAPFSIFLLWWPSAWSRLPSENASRPSTGGAPTFLSGGAAAAAAAAATSSVAFARPRPVRREIRRWAIVAAFTLLCHSAVAHKEMRFVYLLLPLVLLFSSVVVAMGCTTMPPPLAPRLNWYGLRVPSASTTRRLFSAFWFVSAFLLLCALYGYRRGGPTMFRELRNAPGHFRHLEVLTHCYATPGYAHVHGKVDVLEWVDCPMKLDPQTLVREVTQDRLFTEQPKSYALWRYLRRRSPLTFSAMRAGKEDGKLSEEVWWREVQRLMPADVAPALPGGLILFHNAAKKLEGELLVPMGYRLDKVVAHAPYSFEPNEDRTIELWVRDAA